jgi:hypothetical protein
VAWRQEYQDPGKPWHSTTSGPEPISAKCMRMPLPRRCGGSPRPSRSIPHARIAAIDRDRRTGHEIRGGGRGTRRFRRDPRAHPSGRPGASNTVGARAHDGVPLVARCRSARQTALT